MARVKGGTTSLKRRKNVLKMVKGYRFGRSTKERMAKEAIFHAGKYAFAHRRDKKNDFRRLWNVRINGALDLGGFELNFQQPGRNASRFVELTMIGRGGKFIR